MEKWWWIRRVILGCFFLLLFRGFSGFSDATATFIKIPAVCFCLKAINCGDSCHGDVPMHLLSLLGLAVASPLVLPPVKICPKEPTEVTSYTKNPPRMPHFIGKIPSDVVQHYNIKLDQQQLMQSMYTSKYPNSVFSGTWKRGDTRSQRAMRANRSSGEFSPRTW